jgi:tyrosinase
MSDPRYDVHAHVDHQMPFDVHSVPVSTSKVFDTEAWPLCYKYTEE